MALNASDTSNLEQLALKGLTMVSGQESYCTVDDDVPKTWHYSRSQFSHYYVRLMLLVPTQ